MIRASAYGRLGGDPVARETRNGKTMVTASLAVNAARFGDDEDTVWFSLAAFGKTADILLRHAKGDLLAAMGQLTHRRYTDRNSAERDGWSLAIDSIVSARTVRPTGGRKRSAKAERIGAADTTGADGIDVVDTDDVVLNDDIPSF